MDHDTLSTDDFEGEAFLGLKAIPGIGGGREENGLSSQPDSTPAQIRLPLMHPKPNGMNCGSKLMKQAFNQLTLMCLCIKSHNVSSISSNRINYMRGYIKLHILLRSLILLLGNEFKN